MRNPTRTLVTASGVLGALSFAFALAAPPDAPPEPPPAPASVADPGWPDCIREIADGRPVIAAVLLVPEDGHGADLRFLVLHPEIERPPVFAGPPPGHAEQTPSFRLCALHRSWQTDWRQPRPARVAIDIRELQRRLGASPVRI